MYGEVVVSGPLHLYLRSMTKKREGFAYIEPDVDVTGYCSSEVNCGLRTVLRRRNVVIVFDQTLLFNS